MGKFQPKYRRLRFNCAQLFAPCSRLIPSYLGHLFFIFIFAVSTLQCLMTFMISMPLSSMACSHHQKTFQNWKVFWWWWQAIREHGLEITNATRHCKVRTAKMKTKNKCHPTILIMLTNVVQPATIWWRI